MHNFWFHLFIVLLCFPFFKKDPSPVKGMDIDRLRYHSTALIRMQQGTG